MPDNEAMLTAHVQFELNQWSGEQLAITLAEEIAALFRWLDSVELEEVVDRSQVQEFFSRFVSQAEVPDEMIDDVSEVIRSIHEAALQDQTPIRDLIRKHDFDRLADAAIGMQDARAAITNQVTNSEVYSRLIAHVLYQGIKNYLIADGGIARRVPGASSLMKLGKGALTTAAPNFEKSVDRQLTAFVNANIQDSIRESRTYLDSALDAELLGTVADEVWEQNADATIADAAALLSAGSLADFVESGRNTWFHLRSTSAFQEISTRVIDDFFSRHGDRSIAAIFADSGITTDELADLISKYASPGVARAVDDGNFEERIRNRLSSI
jgi:hypothetical protein